MTQGVTSSAGSPVEADDRLNEKLHELLREAAARRAERAFAQSSGDAVAAVEELAGFLAQARSHRGAQPPRDPRGSGRAK